MANILIVDDHIDFLSQLNLALSQEGYNILTASDGLEALLILEDNSIDLILADIAMPRLNGYQLFKRVRQHHLWKYIPFFFLSARDMNSDISYGQQMGAEGYITKPVRVADLLGAVEQTIQAAL